MSTHDFHPALGETAPARQDEAAIRLDVPLQAPPRIANLEHRAAPLLMPVPAVDGRRLANLPISFDYAGAADELDHVIVTLPDCAARRALPGVAGQATGTARLLQAVLLPPAGEEVRFTVQAADRRGNLSNTLSGSFTSPA
jgi:hypothetical protein